MPMFDEVKYPFLVCVGREMISLINISEFKMQPLINAPCMNVRCQQALFFKKEDFGYTAHFTTKELTDEHNCEHQKWHMLPFKHDFFKITLENGCLPISSL